MFEKWRKLKRSGHYHRKLKQGIAELQSNCKVLQQKLSISEKNEQCVNNTELENINAYSSNDCNVISEESDDDEFQKGI